MAKVGEKVRKRVRKRVKEKPFLPDEIITNILIRLPVKSLVRFELVCKGWREMILSRDFVDLHHRSSNPLILVAPTSRNRQPLSALFAVDKWWDLSRTKSTIHRFPFRAADFPDKELNRIIPHAGLTVLQSYSRSEPNFVVILNPARPSHEFVRINFSMVCRGSICAVYYHPSLKEFCSLWIIDSYNTNRIPYYKLLILSSKPSFRRIGNPSSYRFRGYACPLFINDHLYWMLESEQRGNFGGHSDILEFDILSEEFKVIPCPIPLDTECTRYQTHLLNSDGFLCLILILPSRITIWRLQDGVQELWTSIDYTNSLETYEVNFIEVIAVVEGKLAFKHKRTLCVCNLMDGTVKKYPKNYIIRLVPHQMTLASLKNCKSTIDIDNDCNLVV